MRQDTNASGNEHLTPGKGHETNQPDNVSEENAAYFREVIGACLEHSESEGERGMVMEHIFLGDSDMPLDPSSLETGRLKEELVPALGAVGSVIDTLKECRQDLDEKRSHMINHTYHNWGKDLKKAEETVSALYTFVWDHGAKNMVAPVLGESFENRTDYHESVLTSMKSVDPKSLGARFHDPERQEGGHPLPALAAQRLQAELRKKLRNENCHVDYLVTTGSLVDSIMGGDFVLRVHRSETAEPTLIVCDYTTNPYKKRGMDRNDHFKADIVF